MYDLTKILSGLITFTVSSLISIRALRVLVKVNRDNNNVSFRGDNNTVNIIQQYNDRMRKNEGGYTMLSRIVLTVLLAAYPFFPTFFSSSLSIIAMVFPVVAFAAFVVVLRQDGASRFWDLWYVLGSVTLSWISLSIIWFIETYAPYGAYVEPIKTLWAYLQVSDFWYVLQHGQLESAVLSAFICVGFVALYQSHFWLGLAFLKWRTFDGSVRHTTVFLVLGAAGAAISSGWFLAFHFQHPDYVAAVYRALLAGPFGILE